MCKKIGKSDYDSSSIKCRPYIWVISSILHQVELRHSRLDIEMKFEFLDNQNGVWNGLVASKNVEDRQTEVWYENEFSGYRKKNIGSNTTPPDIQFIKPIEKIYEDFPTKSQVKKDNFNFGSGFQSAVRPLLLLGQCFGLFPVQGICKPSATSLHFRIINFHMFYTFCIIFTGTFMALTNIYWIVSQEIKFDNMSPIVWFGTYTVVYISFTVIAKRWPKIMIHWEEIEQTISMPNEKQQNQLKRSIKRLTGIIFTLSAIEHLLSIANGVLRARKCKHISGLVEGYFRQSFPAFYYAFSYNIVSGCFWQILNLFFAFAWNFTDGFVITLSLGLTTQFRQFNDYLHQYRGQVLSPEFWDDQRKYYTALAELMSFVDEKIGIITLISFSTNLYYVCLQLFNSVEPSDSIIRALYFWYSLLYLIGRTLAVSFFASRIHDESKKPIEELRFIQTASFTKETKRLLEQVTNSTIALSGFNFFHITRQFILNVAGTIVTYELVLVQLHRGGTIFVQRVLKAKIQHSHEAMVKKSSDFKYSLRRATREDFMYDGTFHEAIGPVLLIAQFFGVMPVSGVKAKSAKELSFSWFSPIAIYSTILGVLLIIYFILSINLSLSRPFKLDEVDQMMFFVSILCVFYKFQHIAKKWPSLAQKFENIETKLPAYPSQIEKSKLARKIKIIAIVIFMMSLAEHLLYIITIVHFANYCNRADDPVKQVMVAQLSQMFYVTPFAPWKAVFGKFINIVATFVSNYMDLFVMLVSVGLSEKFRQVNSSLFRMKRKVTSESFWREHRNHYRNLSHLCDDIDNAISIITMISFSNNLYFICMKLMRSLSEIPSFAHAAYFWYSLVFLIGRTLAVSLYSAQINDESRRPAEVFRCVPKESWCLEVKRFSKEVSSEVVALSGMRFFYLTRKLVLSVAGTIVTYELVLIQFQIKERIPECY